MLTAILLLLTTGNAADILKTEVAFETIFCVVDLLNIKDLPNNTVSFIERSDETNFGFKTIARLNTGDGIFVDGNIELGNVYYYRVRSIELSNPGISHLTGDQECISI